MEFTVEKMIQAVKSAPDKKERHKLFETFRTLRFYEFIDGETFESFCECWLNEKLYR